jgi:hypothetical protein
MPGRTFTVRFIRGSNIQSGSVSGSNFLGFSIANFVGVINTLMLNLTNALTGSPSGAPYFIFDENTGKFYLIVSHTFANNTSIEINEDLHSFMSGLPTILLANVFYDVSLKSPLNDNYYYFSPVYNNQTPQIPPTGNPPTQYNAIKIASEYNTDYRFNFSQS